MTRRAAEPISAISITPMIDVMLVLLVMLILTIPSVTHKVPIDLPGKAGGIQPDTPPHLLAIARDGSLSWDGRAIGAAQLAPLLTGVSAGAVLHLRTDPQARYDVFDRTLADVKRAGVTRLGFVGNEPVAF